MEDEKKSAHNEWPRIVPPTGDWFQIQIEYWRNDRRCVMSRVLAWTSTRETFIEGITSCGYGHVEDSLDYYYVHGDDTSPIGKTWREVYNETPSFNWGLKDISLLVPESAFKLSSDPEPAKDRAAAKP